MFYYGKKKLHLQNALPFNSNKPNVTLPRLQETGGGVRVVGQKTGIQTFHPKTMGVRLPGQKKGLQTFGKR